MRHPDFDTLVLMARSDAAPHQDTEHLSACTACADTVAWAAGVRAAAAEATSLTAPPDAWSQIESRIGRGERMILPAVANAPGRRNRAAAIAAGLVLLASAGAALVPQTGVRAWLERHLIDARGAETEAVGDVPAVDAVPSSTGLAVQLVDGAVHIELTAPAGPLLVRLRLTDGADVEISATGNAANAQFLAGRGTLEIAGAAGGEITLLLPRSARHITVDVDGIRAVDMRSGRLTVHAERADTIGAEVILPFM